MINNRLENTLIVVIGITLLAFSYRDALGSQGGNVPLGTIGLLAGLFLCIAGVVNIVRKKTIKTNNSLAKVALGVVLLGVLAAIIYMLVFYVSIYNNGGF